MTGRVLVVDDILANLKLLEARLSAEYFDVLTAETGTQALSILEQGRVDVVLLDIMMPGVDGFEVCRRIKATPATMHIPVVMITALDQANDKIEGLEAGADDFLTKPVDDIALVTRVKNLTRLKTLNDEMAMRVASGATLGLLTAHAEGRDGRSGGRILLVEDDPKGAHRISAALAPEHTVTVEPDSGRALTLLGESEHDLLVVSLNLADADGLRLCSQARSFARSRRQIPIIVLVDVGQEARLLRGLDMGVNDYLTRPIDRNELLARVRTQLKRKRYADHLRDALEETVELAITDALTGLHNRRYMETHLQALIASAMASGQPLSLLIADIDHFKSINDALGHDAGDAVLRELSSRLRRDTRTGDLACRLGGEEFIVLMPDTSPETAAMIGERLRETVATTPFRTPAGQGIGVTLSVGIATLQPADTAAAFLKRADEALYAAKHRGRNRVVTAAA